jgi:hypothetical protein
MSAPSMDARPPWLTNCGVIPVEHVFSVSHCRTGKDRTKKFNVSYVSRSMILAKNGKLRNLTTALSCLCEGQRIWAISAVVHSRRFRLFKIPSGGISSFQTATTLQPLCRKGYLHFFRALHGPCVAVAKLPENACAAGIVALQRFEMLSWGKRDNFTAGSVRRHPGSGLAGSLLRPDCLRRECCPA